ncbi:MAG TPA: ArsR family transcriptional regulator [Nitrospirae bacterium]|nr:HTH-type transcriptional repressor AseR [bacterium BMS3Abin06]HDH11135.1 ArsR family transcriptional regulator [Nitrospirota bacterium]HDZ01098.1 ArsR family transcriptional regulator [Nitrospirota bacterium]
MKKMVEIFKLLTDEQRVRILMLLDKKELSVCQLMGIINASQPLISRNLSLLYKGGFLEERRDGKLRFYSISRDLPGDRRALLDLLRTYLKKETRYKDDLKTLKECSRFQKKAGKCDMKTLKEFMEWKRQKK